MKIPGLGKCECDEEDDICYSDTKTLKGLGVECEFIVEGYDADAGKEDFHRTIKQFLAMDRQQLAAATPHVYAYYQDTWAGHPEPETLPAVGQPDDVWKHVHFGFEVTICRRGAGDRAVYASFECNCDWEPEHGLQLVFRNGNEISKLGPFDGHLSTADAYADPTLEGVIYRSRH